MKIVSTVRAMDADGVAAAIAGLPQADGYDLYVKPLRYRHQPHLSAYCHFGDRRITLQIPEPFLPFGEIVPWGAKRMPGKGMRFVPLTEGVTFRTRAEVARFLYCHEWYHWYLKEIRGTASAAEIACDRFALRNYRRPFVTIEDAEAALRRARHDDGRVDDDAAIAWDEPAPEVAAGRLF